MKHIVPQVTDRGFRHLPPVTGSHGGEVRAYESSAALAPHVWLSVRESDAAETSHAPVAVHLTAEAAWRLADQLRWLVAHHYQGDARPPDAYEDDDTDTRSGDYDGDDGATGAGSSV